MELQNSEKETLKLKWRRREKIQFPIHNIDKPFPMETLTLLFFFTFVLTFSSYSFSFSSLFFSTYFPWLCFSFSCSDSFHVLFFIFYIFTSNVFFFSLYTFLFILFFFVIFLVIDHEHWNDRSSKILFYDIEAILTNFKESFDELVHRLIIPRIHYIEYISSLPRQPFHRIR